MGVSKAQTCLRTGQALAKMIEKLDKEAVEPTAPLADSTPGKLIVPFDLSVENLSKDQILTSNSSRLFGRRTVQSNANTIMINIVQ